MTTFTIDSDNNITVFGTAEEAAATTTPPFDTFASQQELAELAAAWPAERLVAIWNSLSGVVAVEKFKSPKTAVSRIWQRIQGLGKAAQPSYLRKRSTAPHSGVAVQAGASSTVGTANGSEA